MQMIIKKWGNSLAARIPKSVVESADLHLDQLVDIKAVNGKIVITPIAAKREYNLTDLLNQCRPEAMKADDEDQKWLNDGFVGKEIW